MFGTPQSEHNWLDQLVGDWKAVSECEMPGGKKEQTEGTMSCRSVGGLWLVGEGTGESAEQGSWSSIMTLNGTFPRRAIGDITALSRVIEADACRRMFCLLRRLLPR